MQKTNLWHFGQLPCTGLYFFTGSQGSQLLSELCHRMMAGVNMSITWWGDDLGDNAPLLEYHDITDK